MGNRLLMGATFAALSFAAVPATAQIQRDGVWASTGNRAYDEGFRSGEREGVSDARERKDYGYKRDDDYEDADRGYNGWGNKNAYKHDFRRGYEAGYDRGYRSFGFGVHVYGGGSSNEYGPYGYPDRGYGGYAEYGYRNGASELRVAFDFGRRDGYEAGFEAGRRGRFEPTAHRWYRSTRGWERRYGARDAYDVNYRNGFRNGYDEGYREGRRSGRW